MIAPVQFKKIKRIFKQMKESEIKFENYDYVIFVDASGDDGFQFGSTKGEGSSYTYVASCYVVKPEDIPHNIEVLQNMKSVLNLSKMAELKSTTLKRHRFANQAYALMDGLTGQCFSMVAFKKELLGVPQYEELCDVKTKQLSGLAQAFPYFAINKLGMFSETDRILIVMDFMKKSEMDVVEKNLHEYGIRTDISDNYDLIFRDSKADRYALIQIADIMAGLVRQYFEENLERTALQRTCRICANNKGCSSPRARKLLRAQSIAPKYIVPFLMHKATRVNKIMLVGISTIPLGTFEFYKYIDCKLSNKKRS